MRDPLPAITESEAAGVTAEIFADIRRVSKVGVVNLVWRHLATIPGGLPWVWGTVRPLYADGTVGREAAALRAGLSLPQVPAQPTAVFTSGGDLARRPATVPAEPEPDLPLPPLLALADMSPMTAELVLAINGSGAIHREPLLAACTVIWRTGQPISL